MSSVVMVLRTAMQTSEPMVTGAPKACPTASAVQPISRPLARSTTATEPVTFAETNVAPWEGVNRYQVSAPAAQLGAWRVCVPIGAMVFVPAVTGIALWQVSPGRAGTSSTRIVAPSKRNSVEATHTK
jgi:hypothetical protein